MSIRVSKGRIHVVIGDTQVKTGVPTKHLSWIGQYIVDHFAFQDISIVHLGDHADMPSLSSYDVGKKAMEGRRYSEDIEAANSGFDLLCAPIAKFNKGRKRIWKPDRHILLGNHENRITRAAEDNAQLEGTVSLDDLDYSDWGWKVHPFLEILELDGINYSHYFYNPNTGRPYCGANLHTRLQTIGRSFIMGHQQGRSYASRPVGNKHHHGMVLGSTYLHDEHYLGPQGNNCWRGIAVLYQVEDGMYDPMFVSLDYLCRKYENITLHEFMKTPT